MIHHHRRRTVAMAVRFFESTSGGGAQRKRMNLAVVWTIGARSGPAPELGIAKDHIFGPRASKHFSGNSRSRREPRTYPLEPRTARAARCVGRSGNPQRAPPRPTLCFFLALTAVHCSRRREEMHRLRRLWRGAKQESKLRL